MAQNRVIAGDYKGKFIFKSGRKLVVKKFIELPIEKHWITSYEVINDEHRKSAASGIAKGLIGGALLGPIGMIAGAMAADNASTYHIAIQWKNGKQSLIEIDADYYKILMTSLFGVNTSASSVPVNTTPKQAVPQQPAQPVTPPYPVQNVTIHIILVFCTAGVGNYFYYQHIKQKQKQWEMTYNSPAT